MKLTEMDVQGLVEEVASVSPAPGGGSVAALSGSLAAALVAMVLGNALKKKGVDRAAVEELLRQVTPICASFLAAVDADTEAFNLVMKALALPKNQPEVRRCALADATKQATLVPLQVSEQCSALSEVMRDVVLHARKSLASDLGAGVWALQAALEGAAYNVLINLPGLAQDDFALSARQRLLTAQSSTRAHLEVVREWVEETLK